MIAGGMLPGYMNYKAQYTIEDYISAVVAGKLYDSTLTPQIRNDFVPEGVLYNYIDDSAIIAHASLLVWRNPDFSG